MFTMRATARSQLDAEWRGFLNMLGPTDAQIRSSDPKRVLIVDDDPGIRETLKLLLRFEGLQVQEASCVAEARLRLKDTAYELVLLDLNMPKEHGLVLLKEYADRIPETVFVVVTANSDAPNAVAALKQGAYDYICKPFDSDELLRIVAGAFERRDQELQERRQQQALIGLVDERSEHLYLALARLRDAEATIKRVACALAEIRDAETGSHLQRIAVYTRELALALPDSVKAAYHIDETFVNLLYEAAPLHDIGKIGVPDRILLKPGPLEPAEQELMRQHCQAGERILQAAASGDEEDFPVLRMGREICAYHHERYDGKGYPNGLAGDQVPISARIIAVSDVYDALTTPRPYRPVGYDHQVVYRMIVEQRGTAFDPDVVTAFERVATAMSDVAAATEKPSNPFSPPVTAVAVPSGRPSDIFSLIRRLAAF
ncbi:MAG: HD domain-containing phosphohydrolase [Candidatus Zipacnadales bacterium]